MAAVTAKVTANGSMSLPAELRHRWRVGTVLVIDRGDYAIVRPVPDDIPAALRGSHPSSRSTDRDRAEARAEEARAERRRR